MTCPVKAISLPGWEDATILSQISAALHRPSQPVDRSGITRLAPRILALACEWSAYAAADMAGVRRLPYPAGVRILRMNCSARFDPLHILWAFLNGTDGVFLGACQGGECHYGNGNLYARQRVAALKEELIQHGFDPHRLRLEFLNADDGARFAQAMREFSNEIRVFPLNRRTYVD